MKGLDLEKIRKRLNFTQKEFAKLLLVNEKTVLNWEKKEILSEKAERKVRDYLISNSIDVSIIGNTGYMDQNFLNESKEVYGNNVIAEKDAEISKLKDELLKCKEDYIVLLRKNT
jgi:transcriptional regulator with XRE-family HTH domain